MRLLNRDCALHLHLLFIQFWQMDGQYAILHFGRNLLFVYIVGQNERLLVFRIAKFTAQIVELLVAFLLIFLALQLESKIAFVIDIQSFVYITGVIIITSYFIINLLDFILLQCRYCATLSKRQHAYQSYFNVSFWQNNRQNGTK